MVLECFASERHSGLGEQRSHDYRLTGLQDYWGCSKGRGARGEGRQRTIVAGGRLVQIFLIRLVVYG
jgi:hypothetical protein